jgi:hypothetical protein
VAPSPSLAEDVDAFLEDLLREAYRTGAGLKGKSDEARIYRRYASLFDRKALRRVPEGPPEEAKRLREFVLAGLVDRRVAPCKDRRDTALLTAKVPFQGGEIPYYTATVRIADVPTREERQELYRGMAGVWSSVDPLSRRIWGTFDREVHRIGYRTGLAAVEDLYSYRIPHMLRETSGFLARTGSLYRELLQEAAGSLDLPVRDLRVYDRAAVLKGRSWEKRFPKAGLTRYLDRFLKGLGLSARVFRSDLAERPRKNSRAFCCPVRVPEEVYLVLRPRGGHDDYHTALHEAGHALHFGMTDPALARTFRRLGDPSLTEGYSFILDFLFLNPAYLKTLVPETEFRRFVAFTQLYLLRRYCGKIAYERRFFENPLASSLPGQYVRSQTEATLFRPDEEGLQARQARLDVDPWFYSAGYMRAWMFAGAMTEILEAQFGDRWFEDPRAGTFLARLYARGFRPTTEDLLEEFGLGPLSLRPVERLLRRAAEG